MRAADNVLEELEQIHRVWGLREIYFLDNVFTVDGNGCGGSAKVSASASWTSNSIACAGSI